MSTKADFPQMLHVPTGAAVYPEGYPPEELAPLPKGHWEALQMEESVRAIKAQAERDILAISPLWQQINDLRNPTPEGAARFAAIDAIRNQSNADEAKARKPA